MNGMKLFELMDNIDDKYIADARIKPKANPFAVGESGVSAFFKNAVSVAAIFLVIGMIFVWTLVGKDLLGGPQDKDDTTPTTSVPDGDGRYGYIDFDGVEYFVFVEYENSMVKNADFYSFDTNQYDFGIEFEYNSDRKIRGAKKYYYEGIDKKYISTEIEVKYGKDRKFQKLQLYRDNGDPDMRFEVRDDGKIEVIQYYDVACVLTLNEYFLPTEITTDGVNKERTVFCQYDDNARLTRITTNDVYKPTNWKVVYNDGSCYYTELICPTSELISYTVTRDERNNIVYSKYCNLGEVYENSYIYTENGIQLLASHYLDWGEGGNYVDYEYDGNYTLRKTTVKRREEKKNNSEVNELTTTIYDKNGIIVQEKTEKEATTEGKISEIEVTVIDYDENGKEAKYVEEIKYFYQDERLNSHEGKVVLYKNGRKDEEFELKYLFSDYVQVGDMLTLCTTQNEYNENYQIVKSTNTYYDVIEGEIIQRVTLEYSEGEDQRLIRKTTENFDDNGNVINTHVENYDENGNIID